ncbi:MAG: molybdopterin-guanine dinucleotide biosynthesis protein [Firmicutes bacterium]|nr:molybdopterin-guanine dinucleotide biosynthesis protein [Bacillota bacterium]
MTPIVSFVGYSNSGKTTFLIKVIKELKKRGYRVGVIKHDGHDFEIDHVGTDTWKHRQAGADVVCIASAQQIAVVQTTAKSPVLDDIIPFINNVDLILTEGFKQEQKPQIEVNRQGTECLGKKDNTIALVAEAMIYEGIPHFRLEDAEGVANLLENMINGEGRR